MSGISVSRGKTRRIPSGRDVPLLKRFCRPQSITYHVKQRALQHKSTQVFIPSPDNELPADAPRFFPLIENPNIPSHAQRPVHVDFNGGYGVASLHKATQFMNEDMFTKTFSMCMKTGEGTSWEQDALELGFQHRVEHVFVNALNDVAPDAEEYKPIVYAQCTSDVMSEHLQSYANGRIRAVARLQAAGDLSAERYAVCSGGVNPAHMNGTIIFMEGACVAVRGCHAVHSATQYGRDYAQLFASHVPEDLLRKQQLKVPIGTKYMQQVNRDLSSKDFDLEPSEEASVKSFVELIKFWRQQGKPVSVLCLETITTHNLFGISVGLLAALKKVASEHHIAVLHDNTSNALYCGHLFAHNLFEDERVRPDLVVGCKALDLYFLSLVNPYDDNILQTPYSGTCTFYGDLLGCFHGLVTTPVYAFNLLKATSILNFIKQNGVLEEVRKFGEVIYKELDSFADRKLRGSARDRFFCRGTGVLFSTNLDFSQEMLAGNVVGNRFRCFLNVEVSSVPRWVRAAFLPRLRGPEDTIAEEARADAAIASRKRVNSDTWRRHEGRNQYRKVILGVTPVPTASSLRIRLRVGDSGGSGDSGDAEEETGEVRDGSGDSGDAGEVQDDSGDSEEAGEVQNDSGDSKDAGEVRNGAGSAPMGTDAVDDADFLTRFLAELNALPQLTANECAALDGMLALSPLDMPPEVSTPMMQE